MNFFGFLSLFSLPSPDSQGLGLGLGLSSRFSGFTRAATLRLMDIFLGPQSIYCTPIIYLKAVIYLAAVKFNFRKQINKIPAVYSVSDVSGKGVKVIKKVFLLINGKLSPLSSILGSTRVSE